VTSRRATGRAESTMSKAMMLWSRSSIACGYLDDGRFSFGGSSLRLQR
jgi:hypothetical protein